MDYRITMEQAVGERNVTLFSSGIPRLAKDELAAQRAAVSSAYRVIRRLGEGATGTVWEVIRQRNQMRIALKIPHAAFRGIGTVSASLKRKLALAKLLDHPNIVRILDYQEGQRGEGFIEMEYVQGVTLAEHVSRSPTGVLSWEELAPLARQLAEALVHSHERGVVHRDIKPANVILTDGHRVKLTDFGSATITDAAVTLMTLSDTGAGFGTLAFMSPLPQLASQPRRSGARHLRTRRH